MHCDQSLIKRTLFFLFIHVNEPLLLELSRVRHLAWKHVSYRWSINELSIWFYPCLQGASNADLFHIVQDWLNAELFVSLQPLLSCSSLVYSAVLQAIMNSLPYWFAAMKSIISPIFQIISWSRQIWVITLSINLGHRARKRKTTIFQTFLIHSTALPGVRCGCEIPHFCKTTTVFCSSWCTAKGLRKDALGNGFVRLASYKV